MKTWLDRGPPAGAWTWPRGCSDDFWREWRAAIKAAPARRDDRRGDWFDSSKYFLGDEFDTTMNYIFRNAVSTTPAAATPAGYQSIELIREAYPPQAFYALMNLLSTHDMARTLNELG